MRNVVFVAPFPMETTLTFARAVGSLDGVRLLGVFQRPPPGPAAAMFADIAQVDDATDAGHILGGVERLVARHGRPHRILGVLENIQVQIAQARDHLGVPGTPARVVEGFRDKGLMKERLRAAGLPCARHARLRSAEDAWRFASEVGFPVVIKPPAGAGGRSTWRIESREALAQAVHALRPSPDRELLAEEFLQGREYSYETICLGGRIVFRSLSRYLPTPLEALENPWIQWCCLLPRDISGPEFEPAHRLAGQVIEALGMDTGVTHMEWFMRPDGSLAVGEIAQRPPGAQITRMTGLVHGMDFHRAWARAVVDGAFDGPYERSSAAGVAFLRGMGQGRVKAVHGLDAAHEEVGHVVVATKLPVEGAPKSSSYEGDGYAVVQHPETEVVADALRTIIRSVRVEYA